MGIRTRSSILASDRTRTGWPLSLLGGKQSYVSLHEAACGSWGMPLPITLLGTHSNIANPHPASTMGPNLAITQDICYTRPSCRNCFGRISGASIRLKVFPVRANCTQEFSGNLFPMTRTSVTHKNRFQMFRAIISDLIEFLPPDKPFCRLLPSCSRYCSFRA